MMSFVSYEKFNEKSLSGPGVSLADILKIGNIVDERIVDDLSKDVSPEFHDGRLLQSSEAYIYADDGTGAYKPCYITFSFDEKDWTFCGACFEKSAINRCDKFEYVPITVAQHCVDKYDSEYIRAAERLYADAKSGVDVTGRSVVADYMNFDEYSMAGYWISTYDDDALVMFVDAKGEYQGEALYEPVLKLLEQKDDEFVGSFEEVKDAREPHRVSSLDELLADANSRAGGGSVGKEPEKEFVGMGM